MSDDQTMLIVRYGLIDGVPVQETVTYVRDDDGDDRYVKVDGVKGRWFPVSVANRLPDGTKEMSESAYMKHVAAEDAKRVKAVKASVAEAAVKWDEMAAVFVSLGIDPDLVIGSRPSLEGV